MTLDPDPLHVDDDQDHRVSRWDHHSRPPRRDGVPGPALVLAIVGIPLLILIIVAAVWLATSSSGQTTAAPDDRGGTTAGAGDPARSSTGSSAAQSGAPRA